MTRYVSELWRYLPAPHFVVMTALGFSAGLPLLLTAATLSAWLDEVGVSLAAIGYASWIGLVYNLKPLWAPAADHVRLPALDRLLGRRRAWMLLAQGVLIGALIGLALSEPAPDRLWPLIVFALIVAFASATQDIVIDAWRIEAAPAEQQALMAACYLSGYRAGMLAGSALALVLAEAWGWQAAYLAMAGLMVVGIGAVLCAHRTDRQDHAPQSPPQRTVIAWVWHALAAPIVDFFSRQNWRAAILVLAIIATYRLTDSLVSILANPFYLSLGFEKSEIAGVTGVYGMLVTLGGAFAAGIAMTRVSTGAVLTAGAIVAALSNLGFAWLSLQGSAVSALAVAISCESFAFGFASAALIAFMSGHASAAFTATQYALFSALFTLPAKLIGGFAGVVAAQTGYFWFFVLTAVLGLPAIALSLAHWRWPQKHDLPEGSARG